MKSQEKPLNKDRALKILTALKRDQVNTTTVSYLHIGHNEFISKFLRELELTSRGDYFFKVINAPKGGGKTHLLTLSKQLALKQGFAVSLLETSWEDFLFKKEHNLYRKFIQNLQIGGITTREGHLATALKLWVDIADEKNYKLCPHGLKPFSCSFPSCKLPPEFTSLKEDLKTALRILRDEWKYKREINSPLILDWLNGVKVPLKNLRSIGIKERIDRGNALEYIGEIVKLLTLIDYRGVVLAIDDDNEKLTEDGLKELLRINYRLSFSTYLYFIYATPVHFAHLLLQNLTKSGREEYELFSLFKRIPSSKEIKEAIDSIIYYIDTLTREEMEELVEKLIKIHTLSNNKKLNSNDYQKIFVELIPNAHNLHLTPGNFLKEVLSILLEREY